MRCASKVTLGLATACALLAAPRATWADAAERDPWISRDKALHFDLSAGLAAATYAVSVEWVVDARWKALALGGGVALAAGGGKELLDLAGLGDPSWKDFAWDAFGAVFGLAFAWSADLLLGGVDRVHPAFAAPPSASATENMPTALHPGAALFRPSLAPFTLTLRF